MVERGDALERLLDDAHDGWGGALFVMQVLDQLLDRKLPGGNGAPDAGGGEATDICA